MPKSSELSKNIFSQSKIVIIGHSLGGQMGSMFIGRYTELADAIILNASCSTYHQGWGPVAGKGPLPVCTVL
jgi:pimeloyl-ACP methyl ester carboxylesterase